MSLNKLRVMIAAVAMMAIAASAGCAKTAEPQPQPQPQAQAAPEPTTYKYAFDEATIDGTLVSLLIKRPDPTPKNPMPAVVYIHGGGWDRGSAADNFNTNLAMKGYFTVSVNYRLSGVAPFPAQIEDCKAAVRWLRANAKKYNIDPDHIGVWGHSAGGHLAALMGTSGGVAALEGKGGNLEYSSKVQAVAALSAVTDLVGINWPPGYSNSAEQFLGGPLDQKQDVYKMMLPIPYITKDDPPFLIIHGALDDIVLPAQATALDQALKAVGVPSELVMLQTEVHEIESDKLTDTVVLPFFDKHLKGKK